MSNYEEEEEPYYGQIVYPTRDMVAYRDNLDKLINTITIKKDSITNKVIGDFLITLDPYFIYSKLEPIANSKISYFVFNCKSQLWENANINSYAKYISDVACHYVRKSYEFSKKKLEKAEEAEEAKKKKTKNEEKERKEILTKFELILSKLGDSSFLKSTILWIESNLSHVTNFERQMINNMKGKMPLRYEDENGNEYPLILNMITGEYNLRYPEDLCYFELKSSAKKDKCPKFIEFINQLMCNDADMVELLQTIFGASLRGQILKIMFNFVGPADSGKTTLTELFTDFFPEICSNISTAAFKTVKGNEATTALNIIKNKRIVFAAEANDVVFDSNHMKSIIGENRKVNRGLYSESGVIEITANIFTTQNQIAIFKNYDDSMNSKLMYIPFAASFVDDPNPEHENEYQKNPNIINELREEKESILMWLMQGSMKFYQNGEKFIIPNKVSNYFFGGGKLHLVDQKIALRTGFFRKLRTGFFRKLRTGF